MNDLSHSFTPEKLIQQLFDDAEYRSPEKQKRFSIWNIKGLKELFFYLNVVRHLLKTRKDIRKGENGQMAMGKNSLYLFPIIEKLNGNIYIEGLEELKKQKGPVVIAANHMSTLETFMLPGLLIPFGTSIFVLKNSLLNYPILGPLLQEQGAIAIGRENPREDLKTLMEESQNHLAAGKNVIIFPGKTRMTQFNPKGLNSIAEKVAAKANVPLIPLALQTAFWANGRWIKDLGPIHNQFPVRYRFHEALDVNQLGRNAHKELIQVLEKTLNEWEVAKSFKEPESH